jgi:hypothetical protein
MASSHELLENDPSLLPTDVVKLPESKPSHEQSVPTMDARKSANVPGPAFPREAAEKVASRYNSDGVA